jgi:hypothetical protein
MAAYLGRLSILMLFSVTTRRQRSPSARMYLSNSAPLRTWMVRPSSPSRDWTDGSASTFCTPSFRRAMAAAGVFAGTRKPYHTSGVKPGNPSSIRVGTSGRFGKRLADVTPRMRRPPDLTCCSPSRLDRNMNSMRPPMTSCTAGATPLYGTCVALSFSSRTKRTGARCPSEPMPPEAKLSPVGEDFDRATRSATDLMLLLAGTTSSSGTAPMPITGVRSLCRSYGTFCSAPTITAFDDTVIMV